MIGLRRKCGERGNADLATFVREMSATGQVPGPGISGV
jgi:hypothetical protein